MLWEHWYTLLLKSGLFAVLVKKRGWNKMKIRKQNAELSRKCNCEFGDFARVNKCIWKYGLDFECIFVHLKSKGLHLLWKSSYPSFISNTDQNLITKYLLYTYSLHNPSHERGGSSKISPNILLCCYCSVKTVAVRQ